MPTAGKSLRRLRRSNEVTTIALASRMGVSRQTLWAIERAGEVDSKYVDSYRMALDAIVASRDTGAA
jgi:DNA-binding XRE family transcriptional regulator